MAINSILTLVLIALVLAIMVLAVVYYSMDAKERKQQAKKKQEMEEYTTSKVAKEYSVSSIFDFLEFEKIEDNMIVQKGRKKVFNGS